MPGPLAVYLEVGSKRVFAGALAWPGWCRSGRDEESAVEALLSYRERYAPVAARARLRLPAVQSGEVEVVERLRGAAGTDFGAPVVVPEADRAPSSASTARRRTALVAASWAVLDEVAGGAPAVLRKGPRGGGRDRDAIVAHVLDAETAYARKLGLSASGAGSGGGPGHQALRGAIIGALGRTGAPDRDPKRWPAAYAARRIAWHALDHAWEIEDRSATA